MKAAKLFSWDWAKPFAICRANFAASYRKVLVGRKSSVADVWSFLAGPTLMTRIWPQDWRTNPYLQIGPWLFCMTTRGWPNRQPIFFGQSGPALNRRVI